MGNAPRRPAVQSARATAAEAAEAAEAAALAEIAAGKATATLVDVQDLPLEGMLPPAAGRLLLQSSLSGGDSQAAEAAEAAEKRTAAASRAMYDALELLCHVSLGARHTMFPGCEELVAGVVGRRSEAEATAWAEAEKWEEARRKEEEEYLASEEDNGNICQDCGADMGTMFSCSCERGGDDY